MARNKESLVLLLDVSPSMHNLLPEIEKVSSTLVQKKLIYSKNDEVGVVLFGTQVNEAVLLAIKVLEHKQQNKKSRISDFMFKQTCGASSSSSEGVNSLSPMTIPDTDNELEREVGGYEHVVVLRNIRVVDGYLMEGLDKLPRGSALGDFLDAIVVGMDMLIKKFGPTNKGKRRLCLITNAQYPIKEPYEGTKEDQVDTIAAQMKAHGMRLDCIIVRGKLTGAANQRIMDENDLLLDRFSKKTISKIVYVESPTSLLGALRTRNISPVTVFRGDLELSPKMKVKVWVYKKTSEEKFPTLKKYSDKAPTTDKFATHEVKVDFEYKSLEDSNKIVPPEQRIKGYRYGPQVVPISSAEWEALKFKPEKSVKLLGFTNASNIMRHYYMKDTYIFIPEPGNRKAILSVSAIASAMKGTNKVGILRCVWRQGQGNVVVGVLTPNISSSDNIPDSFYFNVLPFAEDVREFQFRSFNSLPSSLQPNEQQQEAADNLVRMLDLAPSGKEEALLPEFTPNPILERFYRLLEVKSKQPDADIPPLDKSLKRIIEPDTELFSQNKYVIAAFCNQFELKENPKKKKSSRRLLKEKPPKSDDEGDNARDDVSDVHSTISLENPSTLKVNTIGNLTPVQDFEAMMARRDSNEWVSKAIIEMKAFISHLLETSSDFHKALECLVVLRRGCVLEQEPNKFNQLMIDLTKKCNGKIFDDFWELLASKHVTLISKREAIDSDVADEEAKAFLCKAEVTSQ